MTTKTMIVTNGLFYANGALHLGHILEAIQADIWVRVQRLSGNTCYFIGGEDAHGTPIMLKAEDLQMSPESMIAQFAQQHQQDLSDFLICYDNYYTTHSPENKTLSETFYQRLKARGDISAREIIQAFDPQKNIFLPDRFVKGQCPRCKAEDQYGDNCESCGATYNPMDLINPVSVLTGVTPVEKKSVHLFFELPHYENFLQAWMQQSNLQSEIINKLQEWFKQGLQAWDISRDAPYFGFEIPDMPDKYFYVWLDAPIGYMASFKHFCDQHPSLNFDDFWASDSKAELYHFIGKDIMYFHSLFWPAMLKGADFRTPTSIFTHGYVTVNGQKMSKSRNTFIEARDYLKHLNPEYLRYYFAAKLNGKIQDIDLNLEDFQLRVNSDLVGKVVNIASRCAGFIHKIDGRLSENLTEPELYDQFINNIDLIIKHYHDREYSRAIKMIMELADLANQYIDAQKPWILFKQENSQSQVKAICSMGINLFRILMGLLKPVLPMTTAKAESFLNADTLDFSNIKQPLLNHHINKFEPLMQRIDEATLKNLT